MKKERSSFRHPKHAEIEKLITYRMTERDIASQLKVDRRAVARVRDIMGLKTSRSGTTKEQKLDRFTTGPDPEGCTGWTGRRSKSGVPVIRHRGTSIPASHVAFEYRTGRMPVGIVKPECNAATCLTPSHLSDEKERLLVRMQERALHGLDPQPWDVCPQGLHPWDSDGRIYPNLKSYCKSCNTTRTDRNRAAKKEEANS